MRSCSKELRGLKQEELSLRALLDQVGRADGGAGGFFNGNGKKGGGGFKSADSNMLSNLLKNLRKNHKLYEERVEKMQDLVKGFRMVADRVEDLLKELEAKDEEVD